MKIEFVDLNRQLCGNEGLHSKINYSLKECIENSSFIGGPIVESFEKKFADYCGTKYCVGLNSGTDALEFALIANGITSGEVITVPNSYFTTASSITLAGCDVKFIDIDPTTHNLDIEKLENSVNENTMAILPVHLYGRPNEMDKIIDISKKYNLKIIEDCCQAHGAIFNGRKVPISGIGAFSFFPSKNLGCFGDGGALVTNDKEVVERVRMLRNDGSSKKYFHELIGRKARLDAIQASVLEAKLDYLDGWNELRRSNTVKYNELLGDIKKINLPNLGNSKITPVFHVYNILTDRREELQEYLESNGISTNIHYPIPIHLQPAYKDLGYKEGDFPNAEKFAKETLSLPMFPELKEEEIKYVCDKIKEFFSD